MRTKTRGRSLSFHVSGAEADEPSRFTGRLPKLALAAAAGFLMSAPAPLLAQGQRGDIASDAADARNDAVFAMPDRSTPTPRTNLDSAQGPDRPVARRALQSPLHHSRSDRLLTK